jgi:hypothetical protein
LPGGFTRAALMKDASTGLLASYHVVLSTSVQLVETPGGSLTTPHLCGQLSIISNTYDNGNPALNLAGTRDSAGSIAFPTRGTLGMISDESAAALQYLVVKNLISQSCPSTASNVLITAAL